MLAVHDINDDGWGDVLVLNETGDAEIYLSWEGELYRFWRSADIKHFTAADIDGDGVVEILFTSRQGQVAVLKWEDQQLVTIWENYLGNHRKFGGDRRRIYSGVDCVTSQKCFMDGGGRMTLSQPLGTFMPQN